MHIGWTLVIGLFCKHTLFRSDRFSITTHRIDQSKFQTNRKREGRFAALSLAGFLSLVIMFCIYIY